MATNADPADLNAFMRRIVPLLILCALIVTDPSCPSKPSILHPATVVATTARPGFIPLTYSD
jgi:hypothetical protein